MKSDTQGMFVKSLRQIIVISVIILSTNKLCFSDQILDEQLFNAIQEFNYESINDLLNKGANPNYIKMSGDSPRTIFADLNLYSTVYCSNAKDTSEANDNVFKIAKLLFDNGAILRASDSNVLFFPIADGNLKLVKLYIEQGANPLRRIEGCYPIEWSVFYGQKEIYDYLINLGIPPLKSNKIKEIEFFRAIEEYDTEKVSKYLSEGFNINTHDSRDRTPLGIAVRHGIRDFNNCSLIELLLKNGADPNETFDSGFSNLEGIPINVLICMTHSLEDEYSKFKLEQILNLMFEKGAFVGIKDSEEKTPLHIAAEVNNITAAKILIQHGALVTAKDKRDRIPLDYAESSEMIELLNNMSK